MTSNDPSLGTLETRAGAWELDPSSVHIGLSARGMWGLIPVSGRFRNASGSLARRSPGVYEVLVDVEANSVDTGLAMRDRHLRGNAFLDAAAHPLITFRGTAVAAGSGRLAVDGTLSVRGAATHLQLQVELAPDGPDLRASATTQVDLHRCGIRPPLGAARPTIDLELGGRLVRTQQIPPRKEGAEHNG